VQSGAGLSAERCPHRDVHLAVASGLVLVVVLLASLLVARPDTDDAAKPVYRLGIAQQTGLPASVGVSADHRSWSLDVGAPLAVTGSFSATGRPSLEAPLLDGYDLGVLLGVLALAVLAGLVLSRSRGGHVRWGCQCGERPLVRAGIPNNLGTRGAHGHR